MDSIESNVDLELIAALVDGRLSGEERARAVTLVAESDEALELFANTLRQQSDAPDANVVPITTAPSSRRTPGRWRQWKALVPLAAAVVLAILPTLVSRAPRPILASAYATELARDPRFVGGLRAGWEQRGWAVTRGGPSSEVPGTTRTGGAVEAGLAFRLGVRSLDLQVAIRRGDTALAGRLTDEILATLGMVGFSELEAEKYRDLRSRLAAEPLVQSIERASGAEGELRDLLASPMFDLGEWTGAAELAARTRDASFFESTDATRFIRSAGPADRLRADDSEALRSIDALIKQGLTDASLDEMHEVLQTMIRRGGG